MAVDFNSVPPVLLPSQQVAHRKTRTISAMLLALLLLLGLARVSGECPNGCSSHGKCGAYDMCQCYRNWMANDCSERKLSFSCLHGSPHLLWGLPSCSTTPTLRLGGRLRR